MRMQRLVSVASIGMGTAIISCLAGCQTGSSSAAVVPIEGSRGEVLDQWGMRLREIGMVSVVPPQEDVRVGDVRAMGYNPQELLKAKQGAAVRLFAISSRWGSLDVDDVLTRQYQGRSSWPERSASEEVRPHIVSLSSLSTVDFSGPDLAALVPTEMAPLITGWAGSAQMGITMRVASAESYSLDVPTMIRLIMEESSASAQRQYFVREPYRNGLRFLADADGKVWLQVINEVLYVRTADIAVRIQGERAPDDQVTAADAAMVAMAAQPKASPQAQPAPPPQEGQDQAAADPTQEQAQAAAAPTEASTPAQASPTGAQALVASKLDPIYGAYLRADSINDIFRESDAYEYPGGFTRFVSVTDDSMSLRRTWDPGLAIGVRGLTLEVDAETGEVLRAGPMGLPLRVLTEPVLASDQPAAP